MELDPKEKKLTAYSGLVRAKWELQSLFSQAIWTSFALSNDKDSKSFHILGSKQHHPLLLFQVAGERKIYWLFFHKEHAHLRTFAGCVGAAVILPLHDNCFIIWHLCLHIGYFPNQSCNLKLFCKYCIRIIITIKLLCKAVICQFVYQRYFLKIFNLTNSYLLKFLLLRFSNYECGLFSP